MNVVCTLVIILSNGYHDVVSWRGALLRDTGKDFMVDFTEEYYSYKNRRLYSANQTKVQTINENQCLYLP